MSEPDDVVKVCLTSSRDATPKLLAKVKQVTKWCIKNSHWIIVGDAEGGDAAVIAYCNLVKYERITVWGAEGRLKRGMSCGINRVTYAGYLKRDEITVAQCHAYIVILQGNRSVRLNHTLEFAKQLGKQIRVFKIKGTK